MLILRIGPAEVFAKQTSPEEARITALVDHSFIKTSANASVDDVESAFEGYDASELRTFLEESPHWVVGTRCARSLATLLCCIVPIVTCGSTKVLCCGFPLQGPSASFLWVPAHHNCVSAARKATSTATTGALPNGTTQTSTFSQSASSTPSPPSTKKE